MNWYSLASLVGKTLLTTFIFCVRSSFDLCWISMFKYWQRWFFSKESRSYVILLSLSCRFFFLSTAFQRYSTRFLYILTLVGACNIWILGLSMDFSIRISEGNLVVVILGKGLGCTLIATDWLPLSWSLGTGSSRRFPLQYHYLVHSKNNSYFVGIGPIRDIELICIFDLFFLVSWIEDRSNYYKINFRFTSVFNFLIITFDYYLFHVLVQNME